MNFTRTRIATGLSLFALALLGVVSRVPGVAQQITSNIPNSTGLPLTFTGASPNSGGGLSISTGITPLLNFEAASASGELIGFFGGNYYADGVLNPQRNDTSKIAQAITFDNRAAQDHIRFTHITSSGTTTTPFVVLGNGAIGLGGAITNTATLAGANVIVGGGTTITMQITGTYTVSGLPTCNTAAKGTFAVVSDATAPTYNAALTGSGAVIVPVFCDGTSWKSH